MKAIVVNSVQLAPVLEPWMAVLAFVVTLVVTCIGRIRQLRSRAILARLTRRHRGYCLGLFFVLSVTPRIAKADTILGLVTGNLGNEYLASIDPDSAVIQEIHGELHPRSLSGLAYDPVSNQLYTSSFGFGLPGEASLYSIDPVSIGMTFLGTVPGVREITSLTFDTNSDALYATVLSSSFPRVASLYTLQTIGATVTATLVGDLTSPIVDSLSFNPDDGYLYAFAHDCVGCTTFVQIDPSNARVRPMFATPYSVVIGLAKIPGENAYYTWVNSGGPNRGHWYGRLDATNSTISRLGETDNFRNLTSLAAVYQDFFVGTAPPQPVPEPRSFVMLAAALLVFVKIRPNFRS